MILSEKNNEMRKCLLAYVILLLLIYSCRDSKPHEATLPVVPKTLQANTTAEPARPVYAVQDFDLVFEYSEQGSFQALGIKNLDEKSTRFHLLTKTLPCDTEYWVWQKTKIGIKTARQMTMTTAHTLPMSI